MGRRGPKPQPTKLKELRGNPGRRPLPENEPQPETLPFLPKPPSFLDRAAKAHWKKVGPTLQASGLLTTIDLTAFAMYCHVYSAWLNAVKEAQKVDLTYVTDSGQIKAHPWHKIASDYLDQTFKMMREFGMTPSSRTGITVVMPESVDGLDELLNFEQ